MLNKIAVIGDKDSVLAFKAVGADVFDATTAEEARNLVNKLVREDFAVILIAEELAEKIADVLNAAKLQPYPCIVPIPTANGTNGFGIKGLKKDIEKAIGTDIIFKED